MDNTRHRSCSVTSGRSGRRSKKNARKKRAKQWTCLFESLKASTDFLYDFCQKEQTVDGCKEVLMYLTSSVRDFDSLISTINVERTWDSEADQRTSSVAWEIRKTMSSPSHMLKEKLLLSGPNSLTANTNPIHHSTCRMQTDNSNRVVDEDGWQLVQRRRRSVSSVTSQSIDEREMTPITHEKKTNEEMTPKVSVYDRLYSAAVRSRSVQSTTSSIQFPSSTSPSNSSTSFVKSSQSNGRLMCPKSAMELPQTKASMAKIACSRQKLWEHRAQTSLADKLKARQKVFRREEYERRTNPRSGSNLADTSSMKKSRDQKRDITPSAEVRSLGSIRETVEDLETIPIDPKPSDVVSGSKDTVVGKERHHFPIRMSSLSWHGINMEVEIERDIEWREMREEEESLACEEKSLNKEIENEQMLSVDSELERQVAAEPLELETMEKERVRSHEERLEEAPPFSEVMKKWEEEMKEFASVSWSDIVEQEFAGNYRQPGDGAAKHEKMMSPSRKRNESNEVILHQQHERKLQKAEEVRQRLLDEKALRLKELNNKIAAIRFRQEELQKKKNEHFLSIVSRMKQAEENRMRNLAEIKRKAKDDDLKVQEIRYVNKVGAELLAHEILVKDRARESELERRKEQLADERARRLEEKEAKEHAAEEKRRLAEQKRVAKLQELAEVRQAREAHLGVMREEQERERKEKRRLREQRIGISKAAKIEKLESERMKKKMKFDSSLRRHEKILDIVRVKAQESTSPKYYDRWNCLSNTTNWPSQSFCKMWICVRCQIYLHNDLDILAHLLSLSHLNAWKMEVVDVTQRKLELELCECIIEYDSLPPSISTSLITMEDSVEEKKKRQKMKNKWKQRNKRCAELLLTSEPHKKLENGRVSGLADRILSQFNAVYESKDEKRRINGVNDLLKNIQSFPSKSDVISRVYSTNLLRTLCEDVSNNNCPQLLRSTLLSLLSALSSYHTLSSLHIFICSSVPLYLCEEIVESIKSFQSDSSRLNNTLNQWNSVCCKWLNTDDLSIYGIDKKEIGIRLDILTRYLVSLDLPCLFSGFISSIFSDITQPNCQLLSQMNRLMVSISNSNHSDDICNLLLSYIDPLLYGIIDLLRIQSNNSSSYLETEKKSQYLEDSRRYIRELTLSFFSSLSVQYFESCFRHDANSRSFRLFLFLSESLRTNPSLSSVSVKDGSTTVHYLHSTVSLIGQFAALSPRHQLLCYLDGPRSVLSILSQSHLSFFVSPSISPSLFASLISITIHSSSAMEILHKYVNIQWLIRFIKIALRDDHCVNSCILSRCLMRSEWKSVLEYYENTVLQRSENIICV